MHLCHHHRAKWTIDIHSNWVIFLFNIYDYRNVIMVTAGEKPGTGFYFCAQCGHRVFLEINTDPLPPCTKCYCTQFKR
ncbi:hypothetical protein EGX84_04840 [Acinetobacter baumannii]|nr:hypothetical protein EGX84_04840 [Acinetobacter baumannii]POV73815.1 hypothetical protein C3422_16850 [Acinetobacter sp. ABNIH27]HAV3060877.1 zinc ribbon-containing protein [Acinetobacter baumannii]HAV4198591.1 zinc ribbon-containing protein [Acinetobacter baumannii]